MCECTLSNEEEKVIILCRFPFNQIHFKQIKFDIKLDVKYKGRLDYPPARRPRMVPDLFLSLVTFLMLNYLRVKRLR